MEEMKITQFDKAIGKTIKEIQDDAFSIRIIFTDDSAMTIDGGREGYMSIDNFDGPIEPFIDPEIWKK